VTQPDFAERIGCEQPSVSRFVAGTRIPSPDLMRRIAEATNGEVTANDFFGIEGPCCPCDPAHAAEA